MRSHLDSIRLLIPKLQLLRSLIPESIFYFASS